MAAGLYDRKKQGGSRERLSNGDSGGSPSSSSLGLTQNGNSQNSFQQFLDTHPSSHTLDTRYVSEPHLGSRRYSEGQVHVGVRLPPIQRPRSKTLDEPRPIIRKKKHSKAGGGGGSTTSSGKGNKSSQKGKSESSDSRRSSKSSGGGHSRSSSLASSTSHFDDPFSEEIGATENTTPSDPEGVGAPAAAPTHLQTVIEVPSPVPLKRDNMNPPYPNPPSSETDLDNFGIMMSAPAEEESLSYKTVQPRQETIEGAGLQQPHPDSETEEEAEDRELREFSDVLNETTIMILQDNMERVRAQHEKVIRKYREQCLVLQQEHDAEKRHLEGLVQRERSRIREGVALQRLMGAELEEKRAELKFQMGSLQVLRQQFQAKKEQVAELRERLEQSEEELRTLRTNVSQCQKEMSELVPMPPHPGAQRIVGDVQECLDSMLRLMPDEKRIKDELAKYLRLREGRPTTTGMLHKEPCRP